MSTRGWYEYYVLNEADRTISLSMQFYKWGDAIPGNALCELSALKRILQSLDGRLPVFLLDEMLREQLGAAYSQLPQSFPVGCYLFFLQRAQEEETMFKKLRYAGMRREDRPDYQYGFQIGYAQARLPKGALLPANLKNLIKFEPHADTDNVTELAELHGLSGPDSGSAGTHAKPNFSPFTLHFSLFTAFKLFTFHPCPPLK